jgi:hypothetical protein
MKIKNNSRLIAIFLLFLIIGGFSYCDFAYDGLNNLKSSVNPAYTSNHDDSEDILQVDTFSHASKLVYLMTRSKELYSAPVAARINSFEEIYRHFIGLNVRNYAVRITGLSLL